MKNANLVSWWLCFWVISLVSLGCTDRGHAEAAKETEIKPLATFFPIRVGTQTVQMQLAVHQSEMMRGLMGRKDLGPNQGMIFIYEKPARMSFYMRNTPTPLDIGYFSADGTLREIYSMYAFDETTIASKSAEIQFALEMNQGWYKQASVKPGAKVDLRAIAEALKARGFLLKPFGLEGFDS